MEVAANTVKKDIVLGNQSGIYGTPTFFINGTMVVGAQPFEQISAVIESELAKAK